MLPRDAMIAVASSGSSLRISRCRCDKAATWTCNGNDRPAFVRKFPSVSQEGLFEASVSFFVQRNELGTRKRRVAKAAGENLVRAERRGRRGRSSNRPPSSSPGHRGDRDRISAVERLFGVHRGSDVAGSLLKVLQHVKGIRIPAGRCPFGEPPAAASLAAKASCLLPLPLRRKDGSD